MVAGDQLLGYDLKIGTVTRRTGISSPVLRAWERRYDLVTPRRSEGGQRLYSERDVELLIATQGLVAEGWRISDVARLAREDILARGRDAQARLPHVTPPIRWQEGDLESDLPLKILQAAPCGIVVTDPDGRTRWISDGFTALCGYTLADLFGRPPGSLLQGEETDPDTVQRIRLALAARQPCTEIVRNYDRVGRPYSASLSIAPLGLGTEHRGFVGVAQLASQAGV